MNRTLPIWAFIAFSCICTTASVAKPHSDPLNKPSVWAELLDAPHDNVLWSRYLSKPWIAMSDRDKHKIEEWRKWINDQEKRKEEEIIENAVVQLGKAVEKTTDQQLKVQDEIEVKHKTEKSKYLDQLHDMVVKEPYVIKRLKENIKENFYLLDQAYENEFKKLGFDYLTYNDAYPDHNYNYLYWIEEKTDELKHMQEKYFDKLKEQIMADASGK